jgi:hypothetical protein
MPGVHARKTAERGYDGRHQRERARWRPVVEAGFADCQAERCVEPRGTSATTKTAPDGPDRSIRLAIDEQVAATGHWSPTPGGAARLEASTPRGNGDNGDHGVGPQRERSARVPL